jgi:hypothetical protein
LNCLKTYGTGAGAGAGTLKLKYFKSLLYKFKIFSSYGAGALK